MIIFLPVIGNLIAGTVHFEDTVNFRVINPDNQ